MRLSHIEGERAELAVEHLTFGEDFGTSFAIVEHRDAAAILEEVRRLFA